MPSRRIIRLCFCLLLYAGVTAGLLGQHATSAVPVPPAPQNRGEDGPSDAQEAQQRLARELAKKANLERQAAIKNDTDKLLKLASELKSEVDKSNENLLSMDVIKKADEIEKLAHTVKDKMKGPS